MTAEVSYNDPLRVTLDQPPAFPNAKAAVASNVLERRR